jgi:hypothetical protein
MGSITKGFSLLFVVILAVSSLIMVESAFGQSITKPSVPEFKLSYTNYVYDEPAATSQWSGEPIPNSGYHYDYREVYVKVRNQPNDAYVNENSVNNGVREHLYYNVRVKNHFSNDWVELWGQSPVYASNGSIIIGTWYWGASDSEVTYVGSISLNGRTNMIHASRDVAVGDQVDFQVKALIGYQNFEKHSFFGEESAWSNTQTLTLDMSAQTTSSPTPDSSNSTTAPTSSATDSTGNSITVPVSILIGVFVVFLAIIAVLSLLFFRMHRKTISQNKLID